MPEQEKMPKEMQLNEGETLRIRVTVTDPETDDAQMEIATTRSDDYVRAVLAQLCYSYGLVCVPQECVTELGNDAVSTLSIFLEEAEDEIPVFEDEEDGENDETPLFALDDNEEEDEDS